MVVTNAVTSSANTGNVAVACPAAQPYALGGGFAGSHTDTYYMYISKPVFTGSGPATGWQYSWGGTSNSGNRTYTVYAICSK